MRFRLLISLSLALVLVFAAGLQASEPISEVRLLKTTPYVDVARKYLQRIDYGLKEGSLKPSEEIIDALLPIVKNEPYLMKDALEVLYDLPEKMLYSRVDLYEALSRWKKMPEIMDFLSQRGGPKKKAILMDTAIHGPAPEADRAVAELTRMPLSRKDIKKLIKHYLTRHTEQYFYLVQFLMAHPEDIPPVDGNTLRKLTYLLLNDMDCPVGVKLFSTSGRKGLRMLFKRWYQGRVPQGCDYETYQALRMGAKEILKDVIEALPGEEDPVVKGKLVVLLFDAGRDRLAKKWAETLSEEAALQLISAYSDSPQELRKHGIIDVLSRLDRGRLNGRIKNLKRTLRCHDLKEAKRAAIRDVLSRLSSHDKKEVRTALDDINYCESHPEEIKDRVIEIALKGEGELRRMAFLVFGSRRSYCSRVENLKGLLRMPSSDTLIRVQTLGFVGLCRAWDEESFRQAVSLLEKAGSQQKETILRALTTSEVFPEDALKKIERMYRSERDPNLKLSISYVYLRGLSQKGKGLKRIARMLARGEIDGNAYSAHMVVPDRLKATYGRALLEELRWWEDWMIYAIDIPADMKAESLIKTSLQSEDKPFEERLKRLEEAAKLSERIALKYRKQLLEFFRKNTSRWLAANVQTPTLNRVLGPEGKRVMLEFYLNKGFFQRLSSLFHYFKNRREPLRVSNTSGFVPLPADSETVEFYASYLKKINQKDTYRFNTILDAIRESLLSVEQEKRGVFRPLVPLLEEKMGNTMEQVYANAALRELIGMITGKTPPPTEIEMAYERQMKNRDLERIDRMKEEAIKRAEVLPLPFKIDRIEEYILKDGQRILVISFVLPEGYAIIRPQEPFCIDYEREFPEQVGMDSPADRPYRWYVYRLLRKGYNEPVKVEFYWSKEMKAVEGVITMPDLGRKHYRDFVPERVYRSEIKIKQNSPVKFALSIKTTPEGRIIETPFPVQDLWYQSTALRSLDGSEGRDCKSRFQIDSGKFKPEYLRVVLSAADGYYLKP